MPSDFHFLQKKAFQPPRNGLKQISTNDAALTLTQANAFINALKPYVEDDNLKQAMDKHYSRHFFGESAIRDELQAAIRLIHEKWQCEGDDALGDDEKTMIACKLAEGFDPCTGGFYNRLVQILLFLQNEFTIAHLLHSQRRTLILNLACAYTDETHTQNAFLKAARKRYGVRCNKKDKTRVNISKRSILSRIDKVMRSRYQPLFMFHYVMEELEVKLRSEYAYKGKCEDDGYAFSICQNILKCLQEFLCIQSEISFTGAFLIEETDDEIAYKTTDIHWPYIRFLVYQRLNADFFKLPSPVEKCLVYLFDPETPYKSTFNLNTLWRKKFISNARSLLALINLASGEKKQKQILNTYKARTLAKSSETLEVFYQTLFQDATDNISRRLLAAIVKPLSPVELAKICAQSEKALRTMLPLLEEAGNYQRQRLLLEAFFERLPDKYTRCKFIFSLYDSERYQPLRGVLTELFRLHAPCIRLADWIEALEEAKTGQVQFYLKYFQFVSPQMQKICLAWTNQKGFNGLKLALDTMPEQVIRQLLDRMANLAPKEQIKIFMQACPGSQEAPSIPSLDKCKLVSRFYVDLVQHQGDQYLTDFIAMHCHSIAAPFLGILARLEKPEQLEFLLHAKMTGFNALMCAMRIRPDLISPLLSAAEKLHKNEQLRLFTQTDRKGRNVLILLLCKYPEFVKALLAIFKKLRLSAQAGILNQTDSMGCSLMRMFAYQQRNMANSNPLQNEGLFAFIESLDVFVQFKLLAHLEDDKNVLMHAILYNSNIVFPLLRIINNLPGRYKNIILSDKFLTSSTSHLIVRPQGTHFTYTEIKSWNCLMLSVYHQSVAVPYLLNVISDLPLADQANIFKQLNLCSTHGDNILMLAARYYKKAIGPLLEGMENLALDDKMAILSQTDVYYFDAIALEKSGKSHYPSLIEAYYQFLTGSPVINREKGKTIVSQYGNALKYLHPSLRMDMDVVLAALKQNANVFQFARGALKTNVYLISIAQTSDSSKRLQMIENYVQILDYKKGRIISELEKYALALKNKSSNQWEKNHGLFGNRKTDKNLIKRAAIDRIIRRLQGEDVALDQNDHRLMGQAKLKRILGNDPDITACFQESIFSPTLRPTAAGHSEWGA